MEEDFSVFKYQDVSRRSKLFLEVGSITHHFVFVSLVVGFQKVIFFLLYSKYLARHCMVNKILDPNRYSYLRQE